MSTNWDKIAKAVLRGKKIVDAGYIDRKEAKLYTWNSRGIYFMLDDGTKCIVMRDDEGNDAGVLAYVTRDTDAVLPVIDLDYEKRFLNKKEKQS